MVTRSRPARMADITLSSAIATYEFVANRLPEAAKVLKAKIDIWNRIKPVVMAMAGLACRFSWCQLQLQCRFPRVVTETRKDAQRSRFAWSRQIDETVPST